MSKLLAVLVVVLFLNNRSYNCSAKGLKNLSKEEDIELERQLSILNKPPIKTIYTKSGDIFDCININKQPAFDHPLLKNHKLQLKPNYIPEVLVSKKTSCKSQASRTKLGLHNERCPFGTVPIKRTKKEDLLNARYLHKLIQPANVPSSSPNHQNLVAIQVNDEGKVYYGGRALISSHNPAVYNDQFSSAQIWIQNGHGNQLNSIAFGWAVSLRIFGDNKTRLFSYWTADGYNKTGCFNILCPGFVQVHPTISFGAYLDEICVYGGPSYVIAVMVFKDKASGDWWLMGGAKDDLIGYWPKNLFTHLANNASIIQFGGRASSLANTPPPPMGNGHLPTKDYSRSCFMEEMKIIDGAGDMIDFDPGRVKFEKYASPNCYDLIFDGFECEYELAMFFGGPGGGTCS